MCQTGRILITPALSMQNSSSWQVVLRALYALEAVLTRGSSQACGEVAVMFQSDPSPVTRAASSSQSAVKDRAQRCLKLLLNEDAPVAHSSLQVCGLLGGDQFALRSVLAQHCFHLTNSSVPNLLCRAYSQQAPVAASAPLQAAAAAAPLMDFGFDDRGQLTTASQLAAPASAAPMDLLGM